MWEEVDYLKKLPYGLYLCSQWWGCVRRAKIREVGHKCEKCGFKHEIEVHHKTYERLGDERLSDLEVLCARCHNDEHVELLKVKIGQPSEREILRSIMITEDDYKKRFLSSMEGVMS
ncbi:MAG: hypothetical protein DRP56_04010 [Planctomycetota bacterium]|nr:MAG: hypothetical protein DRP56_04010 [Planctomycetota bacterium]